jgi:ribosome-binding protein aMBF1 (putative translation factor)
MASVIPLGQPMMPDHYSYRRDVNYRAKIGRTYDRAIETGREAEEAGRAARVALAEQAHREGAPATLRRIERLEAEDRDIGRRLDGAEGEHAERLTNRAFELHDELTFWRAHLASLEAAGVKLWGPGDFTKGDRVNGSATVVRVNAKTLTVMHDCFAYAGHTNPMPYDKVRSVEHVAVIS